MFRCSSRSGPHGACAGRWWYTRQGALDYCGRQRHRDICHRCSSAGFHLTVNSGNALAHAAHRVHAYWQPLQQPVPAAGMALGVALCGLQWRIRAVMLAGDRKYYEDQAANLALAFQQQYGGSVTAEDLPLEWVERPLPRRFGKVLAGEVAACGRIARQHGILLDPIYSLAAWEVAEQLACREGRRSVAMLHAGGSLALFGLAQRFPDQF